MSGYKIKPLWKTSCWGRGKNYVFCTLSCHVWLVWPFVDPSHFELPYCLFWFFHRLLVLSCLLLCACISVSHRSSPPPLHLPSKGSVFSLWAFLLYHNLAGLMNRNNIVKPKALIKPALNPSGQGLGWQILKLDPEGPAFQINAIIHPVILLCVQQSII